MTNIFELGGIAAALAAAHEGGLLQALLKGPAPAAAYAEQLGLDPIATERILEVLVAFGLVDCRDGQYAAVAELQGADRTMPGGMQALAALWRQTPAFLLRGERFAQMDGPPEVREEVYTGVVSGLGAMFTEIARQLAERLGGRPRHILDVGAGSGVWSLAMAERHPDTRVTALDLPDVLPNFERRAEAMNLRDRVATLPGNFHEVEVPAGRFDRIVLANILHLELPGPAAALVARAAAALAPGGEVVIIDVIGSDTPAGQRARAVYGLHLALRTRQGRAHPVAELRRWIEQAGVPSVEVIELEGPPRGLGALVGRRE